MNFAAAELYEDRGSRSALSGLNEGNLSEPAGIGAPGYGTRHYCATSGTFVTVANAGGAIDWNCNGNSTDTGVQYDANNDGGQSTLNGYNDWPNLQLKGGAIGLAGVTPDLPTQTEADELTVELARQIQGQYDFSGFFAPVDNPPTVNTTKAGSAVPVKFSLHSDQGLDIFAAGSPASQQVACNTGAPLDAIEETVTAGSSSLSYDPATDHYTYVWKTTKTWAGTCRQLTVTLNDGSQHTANFQLTK